MKINSYFFAYLFLLSFFLNPNYKVVSSAESYFDSGLLLKELESPPNGDNNNIIINNKKGAATIDDQHNNLSINEYTNHKPFYISLGASLEALGTTWLSFLPNIGITYSLSNSWFIAADLPDFLPTINIGFEPFEYPDFIIQSSLGLGLPIGIQQSFNSFQMMPLNIKAKVTYYDPHSSANFSPFISYRLTYIKGNINNKDGNFFINSVEIGVNIRSLNL